MMANKRHISGLKKHTNSRGWTKPQDFYQIKASCLIKGSKKYRGGFVQTEPHQRYQVISQEIYIFRQLLHNGPVLKFRLSWKYQQGWK